MCVLTSVTYLLTKNLTKFRKVFTVNLVQVCWLSIAWQFPSRLDDTKTLLHVKLIFYSGCLDFLLTLFKKTFWTNFLLFFVINRRLNHMKISEKRLWLKIRVWNLFKVFLSSWFLSWVSVVFCSNENCNFLTKKYIQIFNKAWDFQDYSLKY